jgi:hypothetical protein
LEKRQLERAIARSERIINDNDDDADSIATTQEGQNNLRSFLQTQGITLNDYQTQSLARMLVRRETLHLASPPATPTTTNQQQQHARISSHPNENSAASHIQSRSNLYASTGRNRNVIGNNSNSTSHSPPRRRPPPPANPSNHATAGLPPRSRSPRSRSSSPNNNMPMTVPHYLAGPTMPRPGAGPISSHDDQSMVSALTVTSEFPHSEHDDGEEQPQDPSYANNDAAPGNEMAQQRESLKTSIAIDEEEDAEEEQAPHPGLPILEETKSQQSNSTGGDEVASRFSEEDYMDDEQLDLYVLQLEAAENKSSTTTKTPEALSDFLLAQQMAESEHEKNNRQTSPTGETARPSLASSLDGVDILDHTSAGSASSKPIKAKAIARKSFRSRGLQEEEDHTSAVQTNQPKSPRWNNKKAIAPKIDAAAGESLDSLSKSDPSSAETKDWISSPSSSEQTSSSTTSPALNTHFFCPSCRKKKPTKGHSFACDNIAAPHLVCNLCAQEHINTMDIQLDAKPRTMQVPCWLGTESCQCTGYLYIRL